MYVHLRYASRECRISEYLYSYEHTCTHQYVAVCIYVEVIGI